MKLFGDRYASAYDLIYGDKDYDWEVDLIVGTFDRFASSEIRTVLDIGCGTGAHALRLAAKGYELAGVDRSEEMLAVAARKTEGMSPAVRLHQADARELELGIRFDAALMMFTVLGYQIENEDVLRTLRSARRHLREGGLLVFDVWYGPAVLTQKPEVRRRSFDSSGERWIRTVRGRLDEIRNVCTVDIRLRHETTSGATEIREVHNVRYFFAPELALFLLLAGFRLLHLSEFPSLDEPPSQNSWTVLAVASAS